LISNKLYDIVIIGGGIVGCAAAMALQKESDFKILIVETEDKIATHQTGNNSGVIHSGLYYKPGSLKAKNCTEGRKLLYNFCEEHNIKFERCGKLVIAVTDNEINPLNDLSNAKSVEKFLEMFGKVIDNTCSVLEEGRYFAVVIGDKYSDGEWIPLGFYTMQEVMRRGFKLKSTIVKNFDTTKGKMSQKELWRYRALVGGFYIFKHEYIFLFKKEKEKGKNNV